MITKRSTAPKFWPIKRKENKFVVSVSPGPHNKEDSLPLALVLRDILGCAETLKEVKKVLNQGFVTVNGRLVSRYNLPIGLFDVLLIGEKYYIALANDKGLYLQSVEKHAAIKLSKVVDKTVIKKARMQINLHDGSNILVDGDEKNINTNDVLVIDIPTKKIKSVLRFKRDALVLIIKGTSKGKIGKITEIIKSMGSAPDKVMVKIGKEEIEVPKGYVFVIGADKPVITLGD